MTPAIADALALAGYEAAGLKMQLFDHLHAKRLLLVLDGLEHLLAGSGLLAELLLCAPEVKLLTTSRERLNLYGEWVFDVQGLPLPPADQREGLEAYSAVALFLQSARRLAPDFALETCNQADVVRICQLVDGVPLGIELAAAWVRTLSCSEIAQEIERNLDFLTTSARDVAERHRSLRAAFDHSWNLLSAEEQEVMRQLSVFRGGFQREAAEQVAGAPLPLLSALVDKSLLRRDPAGGYTQHELIRQFAAAKPR
jgi:predicted ATPase